MPALGSDRGATLRGLGLVGPRKANSAKAEQQQERAQLERPHNWMLQSASVSKEHNPKALALPSKEQGPTAAQLQSRLQALRHAIAQTHPEDRETRQALQLALAQAIASLLTHPLRADQRDELEFEQANALFQAHEYERAGVIFEELGHLEHAERSYRLAGSIEALENIYARQEEEKRNKQTRADFEQTLDAAFDQGRRSLVLGQCSSTLADPSLQRQHPDLVSRLHARVRDIRQRSPSAQRCRLGIARLDTLAPQRKLQLCWGDRICIGRSPSAEIELPDASLSREHLALEFDGEQATIRDLGSKVGTFLDGDALLEGQATALWPGQHYRVGLGLESSVEIWVVQEAPCVVVIPQATPNCWTLFAPREIPMLLPTDAPALSDIPDRSPFHRFEALHWIRREHSELLHLGRQAQEQAVSIRLNGTEIQKAHDLDLLLQDRLELDMQALGQRWSMEVLA